MTDDRTELVEFLVSQTLFGNDVVLAVTQPERVRAGLSNSVSQPTAKQSFAVKCVPKQSLGTRINPTFVL